MNASDIGLAVVLLRVINAFVGFVDTAWDFVDTAWGFVNALR